MGIREPVSTSQGSDPQCGYRPRDNCASRGCHQTINSHFQDPALGNSNYVPEPPFSRAPLNSNARARDAGTHKIGGFPIGMSYDFRGPAALERDYEKLYPDTDRRYHECDDDARIWQVYIEEAEQSDHEMVMQSKDALDIHLISGALFSGVITAFVSQTSSLLPRDNARLTVDKLHELAQLMRWQGNVDELSNIVSVNVNPALDCSVVWVNGLWFISLVLSMATALLAVLAKQWLNHYSSPIRGATRRERAVIHHYRYLGFKAWRVPTIIALLPALLHISVLLFFAGLVLYLNDLSETLMWVVGGLSAIITALYALIHIIPILVTNCPYRLPFTDTLWFSVKRVSAAIIILVTVPLYLIPLAPYWIFVSGESGTNWYTALKELATDFFDQALLPQLQAWGAVNWVNAERQEANSTKGIMASSLLWLCTATGNVSAQRLARQAIGAVPNLLPHLRERHAKLWVASFSVKGPSFDRAGQSREDLARQAERWVRAWTRLGCPSGAMPTSGPIDLLTESLGSSETPECLTLKAARNVLRFSASGCSSANQAQTDHLHSILEKQEANKAQLAPSFVWDALLLNFSPSDAYINKLLANQAFMELLNAPPRRRGAPKDPAKQETDIITFERAMYDHLKASEWLKDRNFATPIAALHRPPTLSSYSSTCVANPGLCSTGVNTTDGSWPSRSNLIMPPMVCQSSSSGVETTESDRKCGPFTLPPVRRDGHIVVDVIAMDGREREMK